VQAGEDLVGAAFASDDNDRDPEADLHKDCEEGKRACEARTLAAQREDDQGEG
jgi:hypothetical protein